MKTFLLILLVIIPGLAYNQSVPEVHLNFNKSQLSPDYARQMQKLNEINIHPISGLISEYQYLITGDTSKIAKHKNETPEEDELHHTLLQNYLKSMQKDSLILDSLKRYFFYATGDSILLSITAFTYNPEGKQASMIFSEFDTIQWKWNYTAKEEYLYDNKNHDTLFVAYKWDAAINVWRETEKKVKTRDQNGNIIISINYTWYNPGKFWQGKVKHEYAYDEEGQQNMYASYEWNPSSNNWEGIYKSKYNYTETYYKHITYKWDYQNYEWINDWMDEGHMSGLWCWEWRETYYWDNFAKMWVGDFKEEYPDGNTYISYSWNQASEIWEASQKTISYSYLDNKRISKIYVAADSVITANHINGFNKESDISQILATPVCPGQSWTILDSDYVEGNASLLWNYNINEVGGICQIKVCDEVDLSGNSAISFHYKVLKPSHAVFNIQVTENSGEVWNYDAPYLLSDTSGDWQQIIISFSSFSATDWPQRIFDADQIEKVVCSLIIPNGETTNGSFLLDKLSCCITIKTDQWNAMYLEESVYEKGEYVAYTFSRWNSALQEFIPSIKEKVNIRFDSNLLVSRTFRWGEFMPVWIIIDQNINEYDSSGNHIYSERSWWDKFGNKYGNKSEITYVEHGILSYIQSHWSEAYKSWVFFSKLENEYNNYGVLTSYAHYRWNVNSGQWTGEYKKESFYANRQEEYKVIQYVWDSVYNTWKIDHIKDIYLDTTFTDDNDNPLVDVKKAWNENLNEWLVAEKLYYIYSSYKITVVEAGDIRKNKFIRIYPNPASDFIRIQLSFELNGTFELFTIHGKMIRRGFLQDKVTFLYLNGLPKGSYVLRVKTEDHVQNEKVLLH